MTNDQHDLEVLIASRFPIIAIETQRRRACVELLQRIARGKLKLPLWTWSVTERPASDRIRGRRPRCSDPAAALRAVARAGTPGVYVLLDFHPYPRAIR